MSEGFRLSAAERRGLKFGFGVIVGVLVGFGAASLFTAGGGLTVSVVLACAIGFGVVAMSVSDQTLERLYKWPWPGP